MAQMAERTNDVSAPLLTPIVNQSKALLAMFGQALTALSAAIVFLPGLAMSQTLPGILPFSTNEYGVDLATGNVNIALPLRSKNGKIPFWSKVVGTSGMTVPIETAEWQPLLTWAYQDPTTAGFTSQPTGSDQRQCSAGNNQYYYAEEISGFSIIDSTGAAHPFPALTKYYVGTGPGGSICQSASAMIGTGQATDGSGYTINISNYGTLTVYDKNGNYWTGSCTYVNGCDLEVGYQSYTYRDPDGASISLASPGNVFDSLGQIALSGVPGYQSDPTPPLNSSPFSYTDANGNTQQYNLSYTKLNLASNFNCTNSGGIQDPADFNPSNSPLLQQIPMFTRIALPGTNSGSYTVAYEPTPGMGGYYTGRVASIILPSGGSLSYAYSGGNEGINCTYNTAPTVTVTVNDNNGNSSIYELVEKGTCSQRGFW